MFGSVLPGAGERPLSYVIEASFRPQDPTITQLRAFLAADNGVALDQASRLWDLYCSGSIRSAADMFRRLPQGGLRALLCGRLEAPLAATIAAAFLVRAGPLLESAGSEFDPDAAWLRDLAERFPEYPDGLVLRTQRRRLAPALADITALARRDLPLLGESVAYATAQTEAALADVTLDAAVRAALTDLARRLRRATRHMQPGGLFAVYAGPAESITPALVVAPTA